MWVCSRLGTGLLVAAALAVGLETSGAEPRAAQQETEGRDALAQLSDVELVARCPAPTECWMRDGAKWSLHPVAAELALRAESGRLSEEGWLAAIRTGDWVHTRATWPKDERLGVWLREPGWLARTRITVVATEPNLGSVVVDSRFPSLCGNCQDAADDRTRHLTFDTIQAGTHGVRSELTVEQRSKDGKSDRVLWKGSLTIPVAAVDSIEACLPAASGAELDVAVRRSLQVQWSSTQAAPTPKAMYWLGIDLDKMPVLSKVGVSLQLELLEAGTIVERVAVVGGAGAASQFTPDWPGGFCLSSKLPGRDQLQGAELERWQVRVRGESKEALTFWEAERWWKGEFTVPLSEILER